MKRRTKRKKENEVNIKKKKKSFSGAMQALRRSMEAS